MFEVKEVNMAFDKVYSYTTKGVKKAVSRNFESINIDPPDSFQFTGLNSQSEKLGIELPIVENGEYTENIDNWLQDLNSLSPHRYFDNTLNNINVFTLQELYNTPNIQYIYPVILYVDSIFNKQVITLDTKLKKDLEKGKAKLTFTVLTEGWFGTEDQHFEWIYKLIEKNNLPDDSVYVLNSNLNSKKLHSQFLIKNKIKSRLKIYEYNYFKNLIWFFSDKKETPSIVNPDYRKKLVDFFYGCKDEKKVTVFEKHFLSLNRAPRLHRLFVFGELNSNEKLIGKHYSSLGKAYNNHPQAFLYAISSLVEDTYIHGKERLVDYYRNYNSTVENYFDIKGIKEINTASNLNRSAHIKTFVNIVTETLFDNKSIFVSEKLYKPILCSQPFIVVGNPFYLKKLKELGFKTFSDYWDESYDEELNLTKRIEKVITVLEEIANWDDNKLREVQKELEPILIHNFEKLLDPSDPYKLYTFLTN